MNDYILKALKLVDEGELCRATKSYSIDTNLKRIQILEKVWIDCGQEETRFIFGPLTNDLQEDIELLRAKAVFDFLGETYEPPKGAAKKAAKKNKEKDEVETVCGKVDTVETSIKDGEGKDVDGGTDGGSTQGKGEPTEQVEMNLDEPNHVDGKVIMGTGMPKAKKKEKVPTKPILKTIPYDRNQDTHRTDLGKILTSINPLLSKDAELKKKARLLSEELVGKSFLSEKGEVLSTFVDLVKEGLE